MITNDTAFTGKVYFVNKASRECAGKYRDAINILKHHTNPNFNHYLQCDKFAFFINTNLEHPKKVNGISAHILSVGVVPNSDIEKANKILKKHVSTLKFWKIGIDNLPEINEMPIEISRNRGMFHKIMKLFRKK